MFRFLYNLVARIVWFILGFLGCIAFYTTLDAIDVANGNEPKFWNKKIWSTFGSFNDDEI